jgi:WD40 repeat protein
MAWPVSQDYNEAIQGPSNCFKDPDLRAGAVATNPLGIPLPCSGNFADVYQVRSPQGRWAVKCFTREVPNLRQRYQAITEHLKQFQLPFTVESAFLEEGIRVQGRWYPILKMQWIEGLTLNEFVRQHADKPAMLEALSQLWAKMGVRLRDAGVAHCDLQHGNVLLIPGAGNSVVLKLVDYDGMFVPALANLPSTELGHPNYQHPQRARAHAYDEELDRFPLLLIAAALASVKVGGAKLVQTYDNGDNLLFREEDLRAPDKSAVFQELRRSPDPVARTLVQRAFDALHGDMAATPWLEELLPQHSTLAPAAARAAGQSARTPAPATAWRPKAAANGAFSDLGKPGLSSPAAKAGKTAKRPQPPQKEPPSTTRKVLWMTGGGIGVGLVVALVGWALLPPSGGAPTTRGAPVQVAQGGPRTTAATTPVLQVPTSSPSRAPVTGDAPRSFPVTPATGKAPSSRPVRTTKKAPPVDNVRPPDPMPPAPDELRLREVFRTPGAPDKGAFRQITLSKDATVGLGLQGDSTVNTWDLVKRTANWGSWDKESFTSGVIAPDGRHYFLARSDGAIFLYENKPMTGSKRTYYAQPGAPRHLAVLANGEQLLSGWDDGMVRVWDVAGGSMVWSWSAHKKPILYVQYSADGKRVLTCSEDGTARLWNVEEHKEVAHWAPETVGKRVSMAAISPDASLALVGLADGSLQLWDVAVWRSVSLPGRHTAAVHTIVWAPNGQYGLTAGGAGDSAQAFVWLVQAEPKCVALPVASVVPRTAVFTPDCRNVMAAAAEGGVYQWEVLGGPPVLPVKTMEVVLATLLAKTTPVVTDKPPDKPVDKPSDPMVVAKLPAPADKAAADARQAVRDSLKDEYTKSLSGPARKALAAKLLEQARECKDDAVRRFALFGEARDVAAAVAPALSLQIIEEMAKSYAVQERAAKVAALQLAGKSFDNPAFARSFHDAALPVLRAAWDEDDYGAVAPLFPLAKQAVVVVRDPALTKTTSAFLAQMEAATKEHDAVRPALQTIKTIADDPEANQIVGAFYCFCKQDWERGLPYLKKSATTELAAAAAKELEKPGDPGDQAALGDVWITAAKKAAKHRAVLERRAYHWYSQAVIDIKASEREKVEKKVQELSRGNPEVHACWDHLDITAGKPVLIGDAYLRLTPGRSVAIKKALPGPIEITVVCRSPKRAPRFEVLEGNQTLLVLENTPELLLTRRPPNPPRGLHNTATYSASAKFVPDTWYTITCKVTTSGIEVMLNGSVGGREPIKLEVSRPRYIQVRATDEIVEVRSFTVKKAAD